MRLDFLESGDWVLGFRGDDGDGGLDELLSVSEFWGSLLIVIDEPAKDSSFLASRGVLVCFGPKVYGCLEVSTGRRANELGNYTKD